VFPSHPFLTFVVPKKENYSLLGRKKIIFLLYSKSTAFVIINIIVTVCSMAMRRPLINKKNITLWLLVIVSRKRCSVVI
jgi:hypothetical protein